MKKLISLLLILCISFSFLCGTVQAREIQYSLTPISATINVYNTSDGEIISTATSNNGKTYVYCNNEKALYCIEDNKIAIDVSADFNIVNYIQVEYINETTFFYVYGEKNNKQCHTLYNANGVSEKEFTNISVWNLGNGLFGIHQNSSFQMYDYKTNTLHNEIYDAVSYSFSETGGYGRLKSDGKYYWINKNGQKTDTSVTLEEKQFIYDYLGCGLFVFGDRNPDWQYMHATSNSGLIDSTGNIVFSPIHKANGIASFNDGVSRVRKSERIGTGLFANDYYALIDSSGTMLTDFIYDNMQNSSENMVAVKKDGKWGYINTQGNIIIPCTYYSVDSFENGIARVYDSEEDWENNNYYYIDKNNHKVNTYKSQYKYELSEILVGDEEAYNGSIIINETNEKLSLSGTGMKPYLIGDKNEYIVIEKNNQFYLMNIENKTLQSQTVTVSAMPEKTYGDDGFKVEVTNDQNSDLGKFTFESSNTNVATIDENGNVAIKNAGDTNIIVKRSGNDTYADFEKPQKLTVKKVAITVNAEAKSKRVGTDDPELTYTYTGTLIEPDKFTGKLKRTEGDAIGKYDILQNTLKINDNYDITYNKAIFEILDKTPQTITVADFSEKTYGDETFKVIVTPDATSKLNNFTYTSDNENVAKISADGTITIVGAGEANITVTEAGNADYAQTSVTKKLTVAKKALEIKVDNIEITYGEEITPNISYNGFITGEDKTVLTKPVAVSGYSAKPNVGTYTITLSGAEAANYEISYTGATLTVNKKNITVTALKVFDKAADETTNATINTSSLVFDGMILGDDVSIDLENANATFAQAEVGENIAVNVTGLALTGVDAGNYNLTNATFETTANIKDSVTAADIATQINAASVVTDSTEIKLPNVPTGYKIIVKSSDNEDVIKTDGTVAPVESNTDVKLTFSIVNENDETDVAETGEITVTVPASTKVKVDVTAEANGTVTGSDEYLKNSEVTVVATPDSGYKFDGWYNGDTSVSTSASYTFKAESDISLVAKFSRKSTGGGGGGGSSVSTYTVKFETNGGSTIDSVKVDKNKTVAEPTAPTKDGFEFAGWYADKALTTKYDFDTKVTKGITLYAAWTERKAEIKDDNTEPTTPENKITFTDVKENDWFAENVEYVFENGLMNGTTDTEFAPNDNLTRAMLVAILYRAEGEPETNKSIPFADVTADSYYANAVIWAQQNGIVSGVNEIEFAPDENITREQIATIIYRYAKFKGYDVSVGEDTNILSYADANEISEYAIEAMQYAVGSGLIKGKTETTLNPQDNATRAEIAAILQRFIEGNK